MSASYLDLHLEIDSKGRLIRTKDLSTKDMITIFTLLILHFYVAALLQHLNMKYIALSWSDIPELVVHIMISFIESYCSQRVHSCYAELITSKVLQSPPWPWLTVTKYLYHRYSRICSIGRNHNPVLFSCMTYHRVYNNNNSTGATHWAGTAYLYGCLANFGYPVYALWYSCS